jgi:c-di-GMP-binding flagellar brake protein YcgR
MDEKKPGQNRRQTRRQATKGKVKISCYKGSLDLGQNLALTVQDVSQGGARLILKSALKEGQEVTLLLEGMGHLRPIKVSAIVVWITAHESGGFLAGVRFEKYMPYEDVGRMT